MEISMKMIYTILACAIGLHASTALAAPSCNSVPYGSKCTKCSGWMGYSTWSKTACNLNNNPTNAPGFACGTLSAIKKCGVTMRKIDIKEAPKEKLQAPDANLNQSEVKK